MVYECIECFSTLSAVVDIERKAVAVSSASTIINEAHTPVDCVDLSTKTVLGTTITNNTVEFCLYYYKLGNSYGCLACNKGKTGVSKPIGTNALDQSKAYIEACTLTVNNCETDAANTFPIQSVFMEANYTFSYNIGVLFNGCSICSTGFISTVFVGGNTTTYKGNDGAGDNIRLGSWYNDAANPPEHTTDGAKTTGYAQTCMPTDGSAKIGNTTIGNDKFVEKCSKQMAYLNQIGSIADHIYCVQCEPGYLPNRNETNFEIVDSC
ncbi:MAG: hypothetical protein DHS20C09_15590 [marine bacterium B5-7]|nr:MAG: hypothetical protein DHS20C09_15590 [marine bacterium B5-7]